MGNVIAEIEEALNHLIMALAEAEEKIARLQEQNAGLISEVVGY